MGYELHITRADNWLDGEENPITIQEWEAFASNDSEIKNSQFSSVFYCAGGNVVIKSPDEAMVKAMVRVANKLNARVQGDDGEFYDENAKIIDESATKKKSLWKKLFNQ